jgi:hypothetical protein
MVKIWGYLIVRTLRKSKIKKVQGQQKMLKFIV